MVGWHFVLAYVQSEEPIYLKMAPFLFPIFFFLFLDPLPSQYDPHGLTCNPWRSPYSLNAPSPPLSRWQLRQIKELPWIGKTLLKEQETIYRRNEYVLYTCAR